MIVQWFSDLDILVKEHFGISTTFGAESPRRVTPWLAGLSAAQFHLCSIYVLEAREEIPQHHYFLYIRYMRKAAWSGFAVDLLASEKSCLIF